MRSLPASKRAFSSACKHRQVERPTPPPSPRLQRGPKAWLVGLISLSNRNEPTSAFIAVREMSWGSVVSCTDNSAFSDKNTAHTSFHAITSLSSKWCKLHKILIPVWPKSLFIRKVKFLKRLVEFFEGWRRVEQTNLGPVCQVYSSNVLLIKILIIP